MIDTQEGGAEATLKAATIEKVRIAAQAAAVQKAKRAAEKAKIAAKKAKAAAAAKAAFEVSLRTHLQTP